MSWQDDRNHPFYEGQQPYEGPEIREVSQAGAAGYLTKVMGWMCVGLLTTIVSAMAVVMVPAITHTVYASEYSIYAIFIAQLALVIGFSLGLNKMSPSLATLCFMAYSALTGVTLSVFAFFYTLESIIYVFGITGLVFFTLALYGFLTKKDLTSWGSLAMSALWGIIISGIVNIFFRSNVVDFAICCIAIVVFMVLVAYDTQKVKSFYLGAISTGYTEESPEVRRLAIYGAFALYLDFINLFIRLLRIFGKSRD